MRNYDEENFDYLNRNSALAGAAIGGASQASSNKKAEDAAAQANANTAARRSEYDRAYVACLEGKSYTVK